MAVRYSVVVILYALAALAVLGVVALADLVL